MLNRNWNNVNEKMGTDVYSMIMDHAAGRIDQGALLDQILGHCKACYDEGFIDGGNLASQIGMGSPRLVEFEQHNGHPYYVNPLAVVDLLPVNDGEAFTLISIGDDDGPIRVAMGIHQVAEALSMPDVVMYSGQTPNTMVAPTKPKGDQSNVVSLVPNEED